VIPYLESSWELPPLHTIEVKLELYMDPLVKSSERSELDLECVRLGLNFYS